MTYIAIIFAVLAILDIYPARVSRNFIFRSKQDTMEDRAVLFASTLSGIGEMTEESSRRVYEAIDFGAERSLRVVVVDDEFYSVYDNSTSENTEGKLVLLTDLRAAMDGNDTVFCEYQDGVITSRAAAPIMVEGEIVGAVYLYEVDDELGGLLYDMQSNLVRISVIVCVGVIIISLLLSRLLTRRIAELLKVIRRMQDGKYGLHAKVNGTDELSELAAEFNTMSDRLKKSEEMRRRFVSDASHELKTPLASVRILVDSILGSEDMPPEMIREFIEGIGEETDRLTRLTESLLNVSRLDAKRPKIGAVDVGGVVQRVTRNLNPLAAGENISIELSLDEKCIIDANADDVYQIVFNLMENAVKYNHPNGEVHVFLYGKEEQVALIVADTGVGIPEAEVDRVFERFYRVDKARSREAGGSGLGLAIVKTAVEQFGGSIEVESTLGEGTRITVVFPAAGRRAKG